MSSWTEANAARGTEVRSAPYGAHLADPRGLTALGAVAFVLVLGVAGGLVDAFTGPGLRTVFAVCFVVGCALAALRVHREDLVAVLVMPPLLFAFVALVAGTVAPTTSTGNVLTRQLLDLTTALVLGAPVLLVTMVIVAVIAVSRGRSLRTAGGASAAGTRR